MTVAEMLQKMDSREITEWAAFYQLEIKSHERTVMDAQAQSKMQAAKKNLKNG